MPVPAIPAGVRVAHAVAPSVLGSHCGQLCARLGRVGHHPAARILCGRALHGLLVADDVERRLPVVPVPAFVLAGDRPVVAVAHEQRDEVAHRHRRLFVVLVDAEELAVHVLDPRHDLQPVVHPGGAEEAGPVDREVDAEVGPAVLGGETDEPAEALPVIGLVGGRARLVELVPQLHDLAEELLRCSAAAVGLQEGGRESDGRGAPVGGEAEERRPDLLVAVAQREDARVRGVLVGVHLEREGDAVALGDRREGLHRVRGDRDLHPGDREAELRRGLDLAPHVLDQLVLVQEPVAVDADVGVDREGGRHETDLGDEVAEPAGEGVVDRREAAEAREADDLEARAVAVGRDLADEGFEVVLAAVEGAGEAVEGHALDGSAEVLVIPSPPSWSWCRAPRCGAPRPRR